LDNSFGPATYGIKSLFRDEQRKILDIVLESSLADAETTYRQLYETNAPLMRFLRDSGIPPPKALCSAAEMVLNTGLREAFKNEEFAREPIAALLEEVNLEGISLNTDALEFALRRSLERVAERFSAAPQDLTMLDELEAGVNLLTDMPFQVNLWKVQNLCYDLLSTAYPGFQGKAIQGDEEAQEWVNRLKSLFTKLSIRVE
jgi:hypothetical protein